MIEGPAHWTTNKKTLDLKLGLFMYALKNRHDKRRNHNWTYHDKDM